MSAKSVGKASPARSVEQDEQFSDTSGNAARRCCDRAPLVDLAFPTSAFFSRAETPPHPPAADIDGGEYDGAEQEEVAVVAI